VPQCWSGWSYDGVQSPAKEYGVSTSLTLEQASVVSAGDTAAWIGVGGPGMGPGGSDEWLQAGFAHDAGGTDVLYVEYKRPGDAHATYTTLGAVSPGSTHTFAIYERASQRDSWQVKIDGAAVGSPIALPGSHGKFAPVATAENWDGGVGSCNQYSYSFSKLTVQKAVGGTWTPFNLSRVLHDPAYALSLGRAGFLASSR
jgi:hypothetical protein